MNERERELQNEMRYRRDRTKLARAGVTGDSPVADVLLNQIAIFDVLQYLLERASRARPWAPGPLTNALSAEVKRQLTNVIQVTPAGLLERMRGNQLTMLSAMAWIMGPTTAEQDTQASMVEGKGPAVPDWGSDEYSVDVTPPEKQDVQDEKENSDES